ncbi:hypothetical protein HPC49_09280 [Pyxidicoccus fallax]|uniref:Uncharacterized protein n=1 Tax=Pyxidicoccus fallax TaxID=394095 RepID=A0A848L9N9_9BACT|nr:hypothetical protein [Pyxidicoccus fallax]NMO15287.1 hypothetical protein [Pyxidicoccus fallax]NPC78435.1 hypothetical protein [Pyxidicoccus fallax]
MPAHPLQHLARLGRHPPENTPTPKHRWVAVGCLSILAPVYIVYGVELEYRGKERIGQKASLGPLPPDTHHAADIIARKMETLFGATALSRALAQTRVPLFVEFKAPPETMLLHTLFTSTPESVP